MIFRKLGVWPPPVSENWSILYTSLQGRELISNIVPEVCLPRRECFTVLSRLCTSSATWLPGRHNLPVYSALSDRCWERFHARLKSLQSPEEERTTVLPSGLTLCFPHITVDFTTPTCVSQTCIIYLDIVSAIILVYSAVVHVLLNAMESQHTCYRVPH